MAQGAPLVSKGFTRACQFKGMQRFYFPLCERIPTDATRRCYHVQLFFVDRTMRKIDGPTGRDCVPLSVRAWKVSASVRYRSSPTDVKFEYNFLSLVGHR